MLSVAARLTETGSLDEELPQGEPSQLIVVVGGVVSIWISWLLTASALPALSKARYLTVVVEATVNGAL